MSLGGVAHLGERLNGIQEVVGSIPIVSTKKRPRNGENKLFLGLSFFVKKEWEIEKRFLLRILLRIELEAIRNFSQITIIDMLLLDNLPSLAAIFFCIAFCIFTCTPFPTS